MNIKIGDTVRLKSGGPVMTVENVGNDMSGKMTVWCVWFEGTKAIHGAFAMAAVESVE